MLKYRFTRQALAFLKKIPPKHAQQIVAKIEKLTSDQNSVPSIQLEGFIFQFTEGTVTVYVLKIGKRNDGEVYKHLEQLAGD